VRKILPILVSVALLAMLAPATTMTPSRVGVSSALAQSTTLVDFNDLSPYNVPLDGEYPIGVIDWGIGAWYLSGPYGDFTDQSIGFNGPGPTSADFEFVTDLRLIGFQASNGSDIASTVSASCSGQTTVTQTVPGNSLVTFSTGWFDGCSPVTLSSTNGWDTNFDNLIVGDPETPPTPTPTPTETPTPTPDVATATPTPAPLCEIQVRINGGLPFWVTKPFAYCESG